jgi:tetratricopeptide (TPR) repeat protein
VERIGTAAEELGHLREALAAFDEDEAVLRELLAAEPLNPSFHRYLAVMYQFRARVYFADVYPNLGDPAGALKSGRLYLETAQQMLQRDPNNTSARFSVALAEQKVSYFMRESDPPGAIRLARDSIGMFDEMIATQKGEHRLNVACHAEALWTLGEAQLKAGRLEEARSSADAALAASREIVAQSPPGSQDRVDLVQVLMVAAKTSVATGNPTRAESLLREAREEAKQIARTQELTNLIPLANSEEALGNFYLRRHRLQEARACYQRLVDLWQQFPESNEYVDGQKTSSKHLLSSIR